MTDRTQLSDGEVGPDGGEHPDDVWVSCGGSPYPMEESPWVLEVAESRSEYRRLRPSGGYRSLRGFQNATLIYDGTVLFCDQWISPRSRTHDQMVQAARSGRQNIAEGSRAGATSSASELHLTNVARASLEELLLDYEDYLRQKRLPLWKGHESRAVEIRQRWRKIEALNPTIAQLTDREQDDARWAVYADVLESNHAETQANCLLCLIHQTNYLLDQQVSGLEQSVIQEGGYREQLTAARLARRGDAQPESGPLCPDCGAAMRLRTARTGPNAGGQFWGCSHYPDCRATLPHPTPHPSAVSGPSGISLPTDGTEPTDEKHQEK